MTKTAFSWNGCGRRTRNRYTTLSGLYCEPPCYYSYRVQSWLQMVQEKLLRYSHGTQCCELVCLSSLNVHVATKGSGYQSLHCEWSIFPALVYYPVKKVIRACTNTVLLYLNTSTLFPDSANSPIFSTRTSELFFSSGTICGSNRIYFSPAKTSTFHCIY